jgi:hypothetical protein
MTDITTDPVQDTDLDSLGPVDYIVVEFPAGASNFTGEMAKELLALVDSGTIRVIDVLILTKNEDGTVNAMELSDIEELGSGKHCWGAHLGKPVGCAIRISGAAFRWSADRERTDSYSGDHRLHRGR